jgi:hypothetical protein
VIRLVHPRTLSVASLVLAVGVLALPLTASADLSKKPACSTVTATLLKSTFGYSFSAHPTSKAHQTKTLQHLVCTYRSGQGDLSIEYDRYSSGKAARAHYDSFRKSLIRQGNSDSGMTVTQLLPLVKLRGLGDIAFRSTDGTVVEFVDGADSVTIENGFAELDLRMTRKMVALARYVDGHG